MAATFLYADAFVLRVPGVGDEIRNLTKAINAAKKARKIVEHDQPADISWYAQPAARGVGAIYIVVWAVDEDEQPGVLFSSTTRGRLGDAFDPSVEKGMFSRLRPWRPHESFPHPGFRAPKKNPRKSAGRSSALRKMMRGT